MATPASSKPPKRKAASVTLTAAGVPIKPQVIKVGPKGVITIPDENRRAMDLEPGKYVTAVQVGRSLVLSPEINEFLAIAEQFQAKLAEAGLSGEVLTEGLEASRRELFQELYGKLGAEKTRRGA